MSEPTLHVAIDPSGVIKGEQQITRSLNDIKRNVNSLDANMKSSISTLKSLATGYISIRSVGAIISKFVDSTIESQNAQLQLAAVLKSTGYAAGVSSEQIRSLASELQQLTTYDDEAILGAANLLLTFRNIKGATFEGALKSVIDLSQAMGGDLNGAAIQLGKALNNPIQGLTALTRVGITFSSEQKEMIKSLLQANRMAEAQAIILKELQSEFGGSAEAIRGGLGGAIKGLQNDFGDLFELDTDEKFAAVTVSINELDEAIKSVEVKELLKEIGELAADGVDVLAKGLKTLADNIDLVKDAVKALMAYKLGSWIGVAAAALLGITGPVGVAAGAIAAGSYYIYDKVTDSLTKTREEIAKTAADLKKAQAGVSMTSSYGESYGTAVDKTSVAKKIVATPYDKYVDSGAASKAKEAAKKAADELKKRVEDAGKEVAAAITRMESQKTALKEIEDAVQDGVNKFYDDLDWQNQSGLLSDLDYLDMLKKRFADLKTELAGFGVNMEDVNNWSDSMKDTFDKIQSVEGKSADKAIEQLNAQLDNGTISSSEYLDSLQRLSEQYAGMPMVVKSCTDAINAYNLAHQNLTFAQNAVLALKSTYQSIKDAVSNLPNALGDAFVAGITGAQNLGEALTNVLADIGKLILKAIILQALFGSTGTGGLLGGVMSIFSGFSTGGVVSMAAPGMALSLSPFAKGGLVNTPTIFPFAGGIGLMGEKGTEAIMPLQRDSKGNLGVSGGSGGDTMVVHMTINALDSKSVSDVLMGNKGTVESILVNSFKRNGTIRNTIRQGF